MTNYIWVTASQEFVHKYPNAPRNVSFLRNEHRHKFMFKVYIEVRTNDRDIEFILFQRFIKGILSKMDFDLFEKSCEMIANDINSQVKERFPNRKIKIEVSEDGENGVLMKYENK